MLWWPSGLQCSSQACRLKAALWHPKYHPAAWACASSTHKAEAAYPTCPQERVVAGSWSTEFLLPFRLWESSCDADCQQDSRRLRGIQRGVPMASQPSREQWALLWRCNPHREVAGVCCSLLYWVSFSHTTFHPPSLFQKLPYLLKLPLHLSAPPRGEWGVSITPGVDGRMGGRQLGFAGQCCGCRFTWLPLSL